MRNQYLKLTHISERKFRHLLRCFCEDLTALSTASMTGLNRNTVNRVFHLIRRRLADECESTSPFKGEVEVDESYFGGRRIPGKRGRGARGKTVVFGLFKRNGKVYTQIVPDCRKRTLQAVIRGRVDKQSVIHSDGWPGYNGLVEIGYGHFRVEHTSNEFANDRSHINGIESFWSYAKRRLNKFNGIAKETFYLHLKETEFRFNHRNQNLYKLILKMLRTKPL